jgi:hypothetical protein
MSGAPAEAQRTHWGFRGTTMWGAAIAALFVVLQVAIMSAFASRAADGAHFDEVLASLGENGSVLAFATFATTVVCCLAVVVAAKLKKHARLAEYLAIRPVEAKVLLRWLAILAVVLVAGDLLTVLLGRPIVPPFMRTVYATSQPVWLIWLALVVAAPLFEETFFRGFLFRGFESSFLGASGTVIVTALAWALVHVQYDAYEVATIVVLGVLFGVARLRTRSLLVPLALHAATNFVATAETAFLS